MFARGLAIPFAALAVLCVLVALLAFGDCGAGPSPGLPDAETDDRGNEGARPGPHTKVGTRDRADPARRTASPRARSERSIVVRFIGGTDGPTVAGRRVTLRRLGDPSSLREIVTDATGAAKLDDLPAPPFLVRWSVPQPLPGQRAAADGVRVLRRIEDLELSDQLIRPLRGHVVDPDGGPREGVWLSIQPAEPAALAPIAVTWSTQSLGPDGRFEFLVPPGRWWVTPQREFRADDPRAARAGPFEAGGADVRIVVDGADASRGVEGTRIRGAARRIDGALVGGWVWFLRARAPSEALLRTPHVSSEGEFTSPVLLPDTQYDVLLRNDSGPIGAAWGLARNVPSGAYGVSLEVRPGRTVAGRVTDPDGKPVPRLLVVATTREDVTIDPFLPKLTDGDGRFEIQAAPIPVHVIAGGRGQSWYAPSPPLVPEQSGQPVEVRVVPTLTVEARVVFDDGTPVGEGFVFDVHLLQDVQTYGAIPAAQLDRDGRFRLERHVPGVLHLGWTPQDPARWQSGEMQLAPVDLGEIRLPAPSAVLTLRIP